ncbi:MAG: hypothetical protein ABJG15_04270 [Hyphomonadaceae bacterium]
MKYCATGIVLAILVSGCGPSQQDLGAAFPELENSFMEARLGHMPELGEGQCNRNLYAGYRADDAAPMKVSIDLVVQGDGISMERYQRDLLLEATSRDDLVAGQTPLFPETIAAACSKLDVNMLTMSCSSIADGARQECPRSVRWQWLQGFKMIKPPQRR